MSEPAVRTATEADVPAMSQTLARAFQDDPALSWAVPDARRRERQLRRYFELLVRRIYLPKGQVYLTDDGAAVALWAPPDKWRVPMTATLPLLPVMLRACGRHLPRAVSMLNLMESEHKEYEEPHYYLAFMGTDPAQQRKGHGTALMIDMVERCDREGVPAYLEATGPQNQLLYHRHGFELIEELPWPGGGPLFGRMWRPAR